MHVLDALKHDDFDIKPILAAWTDPPRFFGEPSKDTSVNEWLKSVKAGCIEREVPKSHWHEAGQNFLGPRARKRFDELRAVLRNMHGNKYRWDWKRFKVAMRNMCWDIDDQKTETFKVQSKPSGAWWILSGKDKQEKQEVAPPVYCEEPKSMEQTPGRPIPEKRKSIDGMIASLRKRASIDSGLRQSTGPSETQTSADDDAKSVSSSRPPVTKRMSSWLTRRSLTSDPIDEWIETPDASSIPGTPPAPVSASAPATVPASSSNTPSSSIVPSPAQTPGEVSTTTANAPVWMLNACTALDFLNGEHPKAMTTIAAVLVTVGSIPALPGITAVAGGTFLASHAVQAAGAIAVGIGNWMRASQQSSTAKAGIEVGSSTVAPPVPPKV